MREFLKKYSLTFGVLGVLVFQLLHYCSKKPAVSGIDVVVKKTINNYYDTTPKVIVPTTLPAITNYCFVPVPQDVDTAEILRQYFAIYTYTQNIEDTMIKATLTDTVSKNKIIGRSFTYKLVKPIKVVESTTITETYNPSGFYAGAFSTLSKSGAGFGAQGSYQFPNGRQLTVGYDFLNKSVLVGAQLRIYARANRKAK